MILNANYNVIQSPIFQCHSPNVHTNNGSNKHIFYITLYIPLLSGEVKAILLTFRMTCKCYQKQNLLGEGDNLSMTQLPGIIQIRCTAHYCLTTLVPLITTGVSFVTSLVGTHPESCCSILLDYRCRHSDDITTQTLIYEESPALKNRHRCKSWI